MENFTYYVLQSLLKEPEKTILVVNDESVTCREFHSRVTGIANLLKNSANLQPGDRVLITSIPSVDFYCIAIASLALGGTIIVIDPSMGLERCNYCIANANPAIWVWPLGSKLKWLKYILPSIRAIPKQVEIGPTFTEEYMLPDQVISVEHALITFTTGSTGMPKLLLRQHEFILRQSKCLSASFEKSIKNIYPLEERDTSMASNLPIFPLHYLKIGALSVTFPKFTTCDPAKVIDTLKKYNVTVLGGSPAFVYRIAQYAAQNKIMLPVKVTIVGGAPVFRGPLRTLLSVTPNKDTIVLYGSTEVEPISFIRATEKLQLEETKPDGMCVGEPVVDNSVKVISLLDESKIYTEPIDVKELDLPHGEIGEIIISGWHVNTHQVEEKRLIHDKDGRMWLRIEDAGYMDSSGRIWLVGRVKWRVLNEKTGMTFWSAAVEQKILERTSKITFAAYLNHKNKAYLFIEAPDGLPPKEQEGIESYIKVEGIPVDELVIRQHIKKDRRHASKPDTSALFAVGNDKWKKRINTLKFVIFSNPYILVTLIMMCFFNMIVIYYLF